MRGYAIVGAGCAGLSLAVHLVEAGFREPIELFERRREYEDDRTWCAFRVEAHRFAGCVSKRWRRVGVRHGGEETRVELGRHPYEHISSRDFYAEALGVLRAANNVELRLGVCAEALPGARVRSSGEVRSYDHVFDSRFAAPSALPGGLWQCFRGAVVECATARFDPSCATLMDFDVAQRDGALRFRYVLPFDSRRALVEDTYFATRRLELEDTLKPWLDELGPHQVLRSESGALPMSVQVGGEHRDGVTPIGLAAAAAKPSSGYAFDFIQRHARALVRNPAAAMPRSPAARVLDQILLDELTQDPALGARLFHRMFRKNPGERIARFMMESATAFDTAQLMASVPSWRLVGGGVLWPYRRLKDSA